jgi:hypothetical protein
MTKIFSNRDWRDVHCAKLIRTARATDDSTRPFGPRFNGGMRQATLKWGCVDKGNPVRRGGIETGQVGGVIRASLGGTLGTNLDLWLPIDSGKVKFRPGNALLLTPCP